MPRFVARPVTVEAHQYQGNTLNLEGAFNRAILRFQPGGSASVSYRGAAIQIEPRDWLMCGADGVVTPMTAAAFERMFEPQIDNVFLPSLPPKRGRPPKERSLSDVG